MCPAGIKNHSQMTFPLPFACPDAPSACYTRPALHAPGTSRCIMSRRPPPRPDRPRRRGLDVGVELAITSYRLNHPRRVPCTAWRRSDGRNRARHPAAPLRNQLRTSCRRGTRNSWTASRPASPPPRCGPPSPSTASWSPCTGRSAGRSSSGRRLRGGAGRRSRDWPRTSTPRSPAWAASRPPTCGGCRPSTWRTPPTSEISHSLCEIWTAPGSRRPGRRATGLLHLSVFLDSGARKPMRPGRGAAAGGVMSCRMAATSWRMASSWPTTFFSS